MKLVPALVALLLAATACGGDSGDTAEDPAASGQAMPTEIPAADGPVTTRQPVTVLDDGDGAELCLGAVAESFPPQCSGLPLEGWDWSQQKGVQSSQDVRFGEYAVTGTFDGTTFTVEEAVPAEQFQPGAPPSPVPPALRQYSEDDLAAISAEVDELPGTLDAAPVPGQVLVNVVHDDGSLQSWADVEYGTNTVVVTSALVPAP